MIHFCNHKKQTQNDAHIRSQRQTAHQSKNKNKVPITLTLKNNKQNKLDDVRDIWVASLSQRKRC